MQKAKLYREQDVAPPTGNSDHMLPQLEYTEKLLMIPFIVQIYCHVTFRFRPFKWAFKRKQLETAQFF